MSVDYDRPSPAECEPPTATEVAAAIASQGPAPVTADDFIAASMRAMFEQDYPF